MTTANLLHTGVFVVIAQLADDTVVDFIGITADVDTWAYEALVDFGGRVIGRRELSASQLYRLGGMYDGYMVPTLEELGIGIVLEVAS